ncbi:hypothetical protein E2C01_062032 [Portunus trituberculatus]|uniref:Uncharacterized protein n=1 Tax=Portunus trituberculatus TaxID=210409 RepID=A0A5B7HCZ1_PORTR|nr:hypothetical protein [Portunus trituberculatus]
MSVFYGVHVEVAAAHLQCIMSASIRRDMHAGVQSGGAAWAALSSFRRELQVTVVARRSADRELIKARRRPHLCK